jgi:hypothetical protein
MTFVDWLIAELIDEFSAKGKGKQPTSISRTAATTASNIVNPETGTSTSTS